MKRYLTFISLAALLFSCSPKLIPGSNAPAKGTVRNDLLVEPVVFRTAIEFGKNSVSGLMIVKQKADGSIYGSFTNEFGVKGFDFIFSGAETELVYVMPMLDHRKVKKILKEDISILTSYGIMNIKQTSVTDTITELRVLYPELVSNEENIEEVRVVTGEKNEAIMLLLEDFRHKLTIELIIIDPNEKE